MDADLAAVAGLMADPNRARLLQVLLGGTPQSGTALADAVGISRSLASAHLKKLVAGGLVTAWPSGRARLYSLASEPVAAAIETLIRIAPPARPPKSLNGAAKARNFRWARMCYDHLAGVIGVAVTEALLARQALVSETITGETTVSRTVHSLTIAGEADADKALGSKALGSKAAGSKAAGSKAAGSKALVSRAGGGWILGSAAVFAEIGIDTGELPRRRPLVRSCLDWTEHRPHLAGSVGAAVSSTLAQRGWVRRRDASRIVTVTPDGIAGLRDWLGLDLAELRETVA